MTNAKTSMGFDIGSSSVKIIICNSDKEILYSDYKLHKSRIFETMQTLLSKIPHDFLHNVAFAGFTGVYAGAFSDQLFDSIQCIVKGTTVISPEADSIIEIGGQTALYITRIKSGNYQFATNKNCAAGTGSFFEDQMARLGTTIEHYSDFVRQADSIPRLAGRCAVFAKTDIIHLQQDGEKTSNILKGLSYSLAQNFKNTIMGTLPLTKPVFFAGGASKNLGMKLAFCDILKLHTDDKNELLNDLIINEYSPMVQALGCAVMAQNMNHTFNLSDLESKIKKSGTGFSVKNSSETKLAQLKDTYPTQDLHKIYPINPDEPLYLGVDIGSTSTNLVLINQQNQVVDLQYLRTRGDSHAAVQQGMDSIKERLGNVNILNSGVTGSGRLKIAKDFAIPVVKDEITAQARGTLFLQPQADTIFEIGGQDAKFISCKNGLTTDFQMNKVCSAGTGSFIEDQAERLGITAQQLGLMALEGQNPCDLGDRCTVFMKTNIEQKIAFGESLENISAGLCYSVVKNYLHKVVENKHIGTYICFQGGLVYNRGIVAAFKEFFGHRFHITPYFSVTGALGMALCAKEAYENNIVYEEKKIDSIYQQNKRIFDNLYTQTFGMYTGKTDCNKKTIGIPRSLMIYKLFPLAYTYFTELGFNVYLSQPTDEHTIQESQSLVCEETCFPVKLMHGHFKNLIDNYVDYIFMPSVYTMKHEFSNLEHNYGCVYMQCAAKRVAENFDLAKHNIKLLNPILQMDMGAPGMAFPMIKIGMSLGKNPLQCKNALQKAAKALMKSQKEAENDGASLLKNTDANEKVLVLITRNYGTSDPVLNMGIPEILMNKGYKVITLGNLEGHDVDIRDEYSNLYWPFAQHILSGAKIIKEDPRLYAVYLTNHGCGPDSMLNHLFAEIMKDKPYLQIEVDEHFSKVGLITRLEAFLSNLEKIENKEPIPTKAQKIENAHNLHCGSSLSEEKSCTSSKHPQTGIFEDFDLLDKSLELYIPHQKYFTQNLVTQLIDKGYKAQSLPTTDEQSLNLGRAKTRSKEYISFTAVIGDALMFAQTYPASSQKKQLLIFQTEGSETEGMYARILRAIFDDMGRKDIVIFAPVIEKIITYKNEFRECFIHTLINTEKNIKDHCKKLAETSSSKPKIFVTGDPFIMLHDASNSGFLQKVEENACVLYQSICEYYSFLWKDTLKNSKTTTKDAFSYLKKFNKLASNITEDYKKRLKVITKIADKEYPLFAGANARYRYGAKVVGFKNVQYQIEVSCMYENVTSVMNMQKTSVNGLQFQFDGNRIAEDYHKFEAFTGIRLL